MTRNRTDPAKIFASALVLLAMTACVPEVRTPSPTRGSPSTTTTVAATTTTAVPTELAVEDFQRCLRERGVPVEEIPLDSAGRPRLELAMVEVDFADPEAIEALARCSPLLAGGALDLAPWPSLRQEVQGTLSEFSACVRSHGVSGFPDPIQDFEGLGGPFPLERIPYDDPRLDSAVDICRTRLADSG